MSDSLVLLSSSLTWPVVILVLAILLLLTQRRPIGRLIDRVKKANFPGGSFELVGDDATKIAALATALPGENQVIVEWEGDNRPADPEIAGPTQNREPLDQPAPLPTGEVYDLVMLRTRIANLLSELAFPPPKEGTSNVPRVIDVLVNRGVFGAETGRALKDTVTIADQASAGWEVPQRLATAVENSGAAILEQLAQLRTTAAPRFEDHVLDTLRQGLPSEWTLDIDAQSGHARVDASVTHGNAVALVEVRARVHPSAPGQLAILRDWFHALSPQPPVVLVLLGEGIDQRLLRQLRAGRTGEIRILLWDRDSSALIGTVRELLGSPDAQR